MTKVIDYILSIDTIEQKCVVLKAMLQLPRLKYHMKTFGIDQSVSNGASLNTNFWITLKKYQHDGECDNQQEFKDILEAAMVSTTE